MIYLQHTSKILFLHAFSMEQHNKVAKIFHVGYRATVMVGTGNRRGNGG